MANNHRLWTNANLLTLSQRGEPPYGLIENAAISTNNGRIDWLGRSTDIPKKDYELIVDCENRFLGPGLIDCHTHILYGGERVAEFEARMEGASYEAIARSGGGILSTVNRTRDSSEEDLVLSALTRLDHFIREGVTTMEIKSGYGLDCHNELKMLRAIEKLNHQCQVDIVSTFLGAHTVPPEFSNRADDYIQLVCNEMLPKVAELNPATAVDAFCENIAFTPGQTAKVFETARSHQLKVKLHADQLSDSGGAALAARFSALSADHLEHTSLEGVKAMAASGTTAVLLPGAFYNLRDSNVPPVQAFRDHKVPIAIASDSNPGSSPMLSLRLMMNMACILFKLTPAEALYGVTRYAAMALGMDDVIGSLEPGKKADFTLWDINHPAELAYYAGGNLCHAAYKAGQELAHQQRINQNQ